MQVCIESEILEKYPEAEIGYLVARVSVKKSDPYVEALKLSLLGGLEGINATNFAVHPSIAVWRKIYEEDFGVKAKTYRSSIESLLKRVVTGKGIWNINSVVDLYNCCSVLSLLPMGGYDMAKISGEIKIRYGKEGEKFQGLGERTKVDVLPRHVVYADDSRVICWLWNHKDSAETCIDEDTKDVVFFVDSLTRDVKNALSLLSEKLKQIGATPVHSGILNKNSPRATLC